MDSVSLSYKFEAIKRIGRTNCFPSALRITSAGTPRNCRNGVIEPQLQMSHCQSTRHPRRGRQTDSFFSTILHKSRAARVGMAHPLFKQISNMARRILEKLALASGEGTRRSLSPSCRLLNVNHIRNQCKTYGICRINSCRQYYG